MLIYIIPFGMGAFMYALFMMLFGGRVAKREHAENRIKELTNDKKNTHWGDLDRQSHLLIELLSLFYQN